MRRAIWALALAAFFCGCSTQSVFTEKSDITEQLMDLAARQESRLTSFAGLFRVKISREGRLDDFRIELFSRADSAVSIYVRGFLGKSVLKATFVDDSLAAYFPSKELSYFGRRADLQVGALESSEHIVDFLLDLFAGGLTMPDSSHWQLLTEERGGRVRLNLTDRRHDCGLITDFRADREQFPHLELEKLDLRSQDDKLRIHFKAQSIKFNKEIPDSKFRIEPPEGTVSVTRDELADLLLDLS